WPDMDASRNESAKERAGNDGGRKADQQRVEDGSARVCLQDSNGGERAGVRWHQRVRRGKSGQQRYAKVQHRLAALLDESKEDRHQEDQANGEPNRNADQE